MKSKFELIGREFEGDIPEGKNAMGLFRSVCSIAVDCGFYKGSNTGEMIVALAGHPKAEEIAKKTLDGWSVDGVEITSKSWSDLFESKGHYLDPYAASIKVWVDGGFLAIGST